MGSDLINGHGQGYYKYIYFSRLHALCECSKIHSIRHLLCNLHSMVSRPNFRHLPKIIFRRLAWFYCVVSSTEKIIAIMSLVKVH